MSSKIKIKDSIFKEIKNREQNKQEKKKAYIRL